MKKTLKTGAVRKQILATQKVLKKTARKEPTKKVSKHEKSYIAIYAKIDVSTVERRNRVDYIALNTGYVSRLLCDNESDEPKFRFKLPSKFGAKFAEWEDWCSLSKYERALKEDECETNDDEHAFCVVLLSDYIDGKGLYLFTKDAKELTQYSDFEGAIVFRRPSKDPMNIAEYMTVAKSIDINYCDGYEPSNINDMTILTLPNGKTMLYVSYDDCESE